jgi:hypothetical protein
LADIRTGASLDPAALISDEKIEMTDWELHDFAVQVVRDALVKQGRELMSSQGNPQIDPQLWFVGDKGPEWVIVRSARFPAERADVPSNWRDIAAQSARLGRVGHFASVSIAAGNEFADREDVGIPMPLWRGHGMIVAYEGLEPLTMPGPRR